MNGAGVKVVVAMLLVFVVASGTAVAQPVLSVAAEPGAEKPMMGANPIAGVPCYTWWYGCSPTSGGMLVGFWDGQPGYGNLFDGDASVESAATRAMVASTAHIVAGSENGYTYGDWHNSASYPSHEANPDCMADFMKTVDGFSSSGNIASGLKAYVEWDNPSTPVNESYAATVTLDSVAYYGGTWTYADFKAEIDAGRPVLLDVLCARRRDDWVGHSVVGYGYQDSMFQVKLPGSTVDVTVGGFAVMDTWNCPPAGGQSEWVDWSYNVFGSSFDSNGVEWWPYIDFQGFSWIYTSGAPLYDWMVADGITLDIETCTDVIPEPATMAMFGLASLGLVLRRRRNRAA